LIRGKPKGLSARAPPRLGRPRWASSLPSRRAGLTRPACGRARCPRGPSASLVAVRVPSALGRAPNLGCSCPARLGRPRRASLLGRSPAPLLGRLRTLWPATSHTAGLAGAARLGCLLAGPGRAGPFRAQGVLAFFSGVLQF